jgi:hypothetical protein
VVLPDFALVSFVLQLRPLNALCQSEEIGNLETTAILIENPKKPQPLEVTEDAASCVG